MKFAPVHPTAAGIENFQLTLEAVQRVYKAIDPKPRFPVSTNPNNPLGGNYPQQLLEEIYEWGLEYTDMHII